MRNTLLLMLIALLLLLSCAKQEKQEKPLLLASIHPYELLLAQLAGSEFQVRCIIPAGASPHTWSPGPADLKSFSEAAFIFSNGLGLEANLQKNFIQRADVHVSAASMLNELLEADSLASPDIGAEEHEAEHDHHHSGQDPHLWTSPFLMIRLVGRLEKELSLRFPNSAFVFQRNADTIRKELEQTAATIKSERSTYSKPGIVTYHNSFHYFTQEFGIEYLGWVQSSPGKEPTPKDLSQLGKTLREHSSKAVFIEPQMDKKAGQVLAKEFGLSLLTLDPLGSDGKAKTISELIINNWNSMKQGF